MNSYWPDSIGDFTKQEDWQEHDACFAPDCNCPEWCGIVNEKEFEDDQD